MRYGMRVLLVLLFFSNASLGVAKSLNDIEFADQMTLNEKTLVLNGLGLRKVSKWGIPVKVYVAGLYVETKSSEGAQILNSKTPKILKMVFLQNVDKEKLAQAWKEGALANCSSENCEEVKNKVEEFNKSMVDSKVKGSIVVRFFPQKVEVEMEGRGRRSGSVASEAFSKTLLAVFIGAHPATTELRDGLLGK